MIYSKVQNTFNDCFGEHLLTITLYNNYTLVLKSNESTVVVIPYNIFYVLFLTKCFKRSTKVNKLPEQSFSITVVFHYSTMGIPFRLSSVYPSRSTPHFL